MNLWSGFFWPYWTIQKMQMHSQYQVGLRCLQAPCGQSYCSLLFFVLFSRGGRKREQGGRSNKTSGDSLTPDPRPLPLPAAHHPAVISFAFSQKGVIQGCEYGCMHDVPMYQQGFQIGYRITTSRDPLCQEPWKKDASVLVAGNGFAILEHNAHTSKPLRFSDFWHLIFEQAGTRNKGR